MALAISLVVIVSNAILSTLLTEIRIVNLFPAVVLAALLGGLRAGLIATLLCAVVGLYVWLPPVFSFRVNAAADRIALGGFIASGVVMSYLIHRLHEMRFRAERSEERLVQALENEVVARRAAERSRAETELLFRLAEATSRSERLGDVYDSALGGAHDLLDAERSAILLLDTDGVMRFKAWRCLSDAYRAAVEGYSPWSPGEREPEPILIADVDQDEAMAPFLPLFETEQIRALIFVPLVHQRRLLGKLMMYWELPRYHTSDDQDLALTIAAHVAQAIDRARIHDAERTARDRVERLQRVTASLNEALTREKIGSVCLPVVCEAIGATTGSLYLLTADGAELEAVQFVGLPPEIAQNFRRIPITANVSATEAVRTGRPVFLESRQAFEARYPEVAARYPVEVEARASIPLIIDGRIIGAMGIGFSSWRIMSEDDLAFLMSVADQCAQALDRSAAYDRHRRAEEKLHVALNAGRMGVWEWNIDTGRVSWSPTLEAIHGLEPGVFPGTFEASQRDIHADDRERVLSTIQATLEGKSEHHLEYRIVRTDGQERWVAAHGRVAADASGRPISMMGVCMDVTGQKQLEAAREAELAELQRSARFNEIFTGILGHDLRTPLAAVMLAAHTASRQKEGEKLIKPLSRILKSGERMGRMIEQLLDFTRVRLGAGIQLEARPVELVAVVRQIVEELDDAYPDCSLRFEHRGSAEGVWDPDRLGQVFSNLIANALQHGIPQHGVRVHLDGVSREAVRIEVQNMGSIPAELLPSVFEPLTGGERRRDRSQGLGLGLFITQEIVKAHRGSIEVQSDQESGTRFIVHLPRIAPGIGHA